MLILSFLTLMSACKQPNQIPVLTELRVYDSGVYGRLEESGKYFGNFTINHISEEITLTRNDGFKFGSEITSAKSIRFDGGKMIWEFNSGRILLVCQLSAEQWRIISSLADKMSNQNRIKFEIGE